MINWEESESASFCFITALAKVHPLFFSFRLCYALSYGVYLSSFLKDMVCSPRPYAPPVTRLSKEQSISSSVPRLISRLAVGNHHLEYGFPSTHSANSVSMALFLGAHVHDLHLLDPCRPQRSRLGSSHLCCTSYQLRAVGCTRGCTDSWTFPSGSSSELLGWYCNAW